MFHSQQLAAKAIEIDCPGIGDSNCNSTYHDERRWVDCYGVRLKILKKDILVSGILKT